MTFWDWLSRVGPGWPNGRGWYAAALFLQTCAILVLLYVAPELGKNDFFQTLATAIVVTGWVGFAVAGRDNRIDREQVGQAQALAQELVAHLRQQAALPAQPAGLPAPTVAEPAP